MGTGRGRAALWPRPDGFEDNGQGDLLAGPIGFRASSCWRRTAQVRKMPSPVSSRPSTLLAASKPGPGSCGPP